MEIDLEKIEIKNVVKHGDTYSCDFNHPELGWIPFGVSAEDTSAHGQRIFEMCSTKKRVKEVEHPGLRGSARTWRDEELKRADVKVEMAADGEDVIGTEQEWRDYRKLLRRWPETSDFPKVAPKAPDAQE